MKDISKAGATQLSTGSKTSDWVVKLGDDILYTLPACTTVEETFTIRDSINALLKKAFNAGLEEANSLAHVKLKRVVDGGNLQLDELKIENERLADILENLLNSEE